MSGNKTGEKTSEMGSGLGHSTTTRGDTVNLRAPVDLSHRVGLSALQAVF